MFGSSILEVAVGVVFVFAIVSVICSAIREGLEAWLKTRATFLEHGIREFLHDHSGTATARHLFEHPLVCSLYEGSYAPRTSRWMPRAFTGGGTLPSYLPSRNVAIALMDIAARGPATDLVSSHPAGAALTLESVRANIQNVGNPAVQRALLTAIDTAQGDLETAIANVEAWYDAGMDRVSGWYKRSTHWILFAVGLAFAFSANIDALAIAHYLYRHDAERAALVARAQSASADANFLGGSYAEMKEQLASVNVPIGWGNGAHPVNPSKPTTLRYVEVGLGWLITALAATMGAPFWFDFLNKVMVVRSTVKPHEKSPEEASKDGQQPAPGIPASIVPVPRAPAPPVRAMLVDADSRVDGCDVTVTAATPDAELPPAEGGVA